MTHKSRRFETFKDYWNWKKLHQPTPKHIVLAVVGTLVIHIILVE
jgi:hypothetical protein